ncbi:MAG: hypothetical protein IPQ26_10095 [Elusimicrobia bacterium]|nr:hypothetical protein [Elusimicrobiota bacterium]
MSIERWEMLLSTRADSYLLKIRGPREDVEKIVQAHPDVCGEIQEITDDTFQWAVFVVDAPLKERLAIQNVVMSMTRDPGAGPTASHELGNLLDGLSGALEGLTNLTEDEQSFVMKKVAQMQEGAISPGPLIPPGIKIGGGASKAVVPPLKPVEKPAAAKPPTPPPSMPRSETPGPARTTPPMPPAAPPPPSIVRPVQAPSSIPKAPPPFSPKGTPAPAAHAAPPPPSATQIPPPPMRIPPPPPPVAPVAAPPPRDMPSPAPTFAPPPVAKSPPPPPAREAPPPPVRETPPPPAPKAPAVENPNASGRFQIDFGYNTSPTPPVDPSEASTPAIEQAIDSGGFQIEITHDYGEPMGATHPPAAKSPAPPRTPGVEPLASGPNAAPVEPVKPVVTPFGPAAILAGDSAPAKPAPVAPTPEDTALASAIFYPEGTETSRDKFVQILADIAQKKAKKPINFRWVNTQAVEIALDHAVEWIWTAKANGAECFFVILPSNVPPEEMEGVVVEAQHAGMKCFLVPMSEIGSKLLYMNLMVELMLVKKKGR